ncbi:uncharacterized protein [Euphorbia lathyris]|uniref:uncharacterized protein isoform X2 n=1 Tax=Euphorbia lathyris TaxID=212925 RepID=UPI003313A39B
MATSAFKSTSKRTPIGKTSSAATTDDSFSSNRTSSAHRRSRSLSRFSHPLHSPVDDAPKGRFVNTIRGSGFPDVTLDDLAVQFFDSADRGRSSLWKDGVSPGDKASVSQRRGRSVSRHGSRVGEGKGNVGNSYAGGSRLNSENNSRRRRSVSVVRCQISDSEQSDLDLYQNSSNGGSSKSFSGRNNQVALANKTPVSNHKPGLRRSLSQRDLKYQDGYSSHSSAITDDEGRDAHSNINGIERTIRTVYAQKKAAEHPIGDDTNNGLYEVMRKELRNAVEEIKMELEHGTRKPVLDRLQPKNSDAVRAVSTMKKEYATKLEMSEKRKQDLLAEMLLEEQRGKELSKIFKELLADPKESAADKPMRTRKRSNDRNRMSTRLTEEAEKYFEDFISNVEDTDISSLDGERSDTSSSIGGLSKTRSFQSPAAISKSVPVEMDGVVLPWLKWETSNDFSPLSIKKLHSTSTSDTHLGEAAQEATPVHDLSNHSLSSRGSWSPSVSHSINVDELSRNGLREELSCHSGCSYSGARPQFDVDEYLNRESEEDFLMERWKQQQRLHSGSLLLCNQMFF